MLVNARKCPFLGPAHPLFVLHFTGISPDKMAAKFEFISSVENVFKKIFLGGIFDTLQETFYGKQEESEESSKQGTFLSNFIQN